MSQSCSTLTVLVHVQKYTPCQGVVWSQYRMPSTFYVPLAFGVVLFAKVCFLLPMQFCKAVDFTLTLLYLNFKLQYIMNYSSNFYNFCRFQLLVVRSYSTYFYSIGKKYTPCQGVVWSQYRLPGIFNVHDILVWFCLPRCVFSYQRSFKKLYILHWLYCNQTLRYNIS